LALAGAAIHAAWNLLLVRRPDPQAATAVALLIGSVAFAPVALLSWDVQPGAWPYVTTSSLVELTYFALLAFAFRHATFTVVYPVGRGLAPVLVLLAGALLLAQRASVGQVAGVALVAIGILFVRGMSGGAAPARDLGLGVAIAVAIAAYTLIDQQGLAYAGPLPYLWLIMTLPGVSYALLQARRVGAAGLRAELVPAVALAGVGMFGSYAFVLAALTISTAAPVAAVRESSVVIATFAAGLLGIEPVGRRRVVGSAIVVAGVALLSLG
jgi:drug/metabolite transporter (DMT)-like permease